MSKHTLIVALMAAAIASSPAAFAGPKWLDRLKGEQGDSSQQENSEDKPAAAKGDKKTREKRDNGQPFMASEVQQVKGLRDYEGEIYGKAAPGSPFSKLKIGMPERQVMDLVGQPTDIGGYDTGKHHIPFYYGGDTGRTEMAYKGIGRLIFSNSRDGATYLIRIVHDKSEDGYR